MFSDWMLRLRALFKRTAVERDIDDELRFHLDHQVDQYTAQGVGRGEAIRLARLDFGGLEQVREEYRESLGVRLVEELWRDLRLAIRMLRATPIVTAVAILSIALGIGANTAIFSLIESLVLRKLPVRDPERLVLVTTTAPGVRAWSYPVWEQFRHSSVFEHSAAAALRRFNLASGGETQFVNGLWASGAFFETLGIPALIGRTFSALDDQSGGGPDGRVAVIGYDFWSRHFGRAPDVLGRTIVLNDVPFTIIGVTPPGFFGIEVGRSFDVAAPLETNTGSRAATTTWLTVIARLKPGQTVDAGTAVLRGLQPHIRDATLPPKASEAYRKTYLQTSFALIPAARGSSSLRRQYERPLFALLVVVVLVMLVACANIANLLLARAAARRHEFSVRAALGASRGQLVRQVLVESIALAVAGAAVGILIANWGSRALVLELSKQTATENTTAFLDLSFNWPVLAFTIGTTIVSVLLFGAAPAVRASLIAPDTLREARQATGHTRAGLSNSFVVAQLAFSVVLVVAAGLFVRTFTSLTARPLGFDPDHVLVVTVGAERSPIAPAERLAIFALATEAVRLLPGITDVAASLMTPVSGLGLTNNAIEVAGFPRLPDGERSVSVNHVSPGYFRTLGTPLLAGRDISDADSATASPVAIVNEAFIRNFLDGENPLGRAVIGLGAAAIPIVGVVADAIYRSLREPPVPTVYLPFAQSREATAFAMMSLTVRSADSPDSLTRSLTATLKDVNPDLTWTFRPLADQIDVSITQERLTAVLAAAFGGLALLLAGLGLYGVTAYNVSRRRFEIGVRMALGATATSIVRGVVSRVALLIAIGTAAGVAVSLWLSQFVEPLLYGVEPQDPASVLIALVVLAVIGLAAAAVPASRAARVDAADTLRAE